MDQSRTLAIELAGVAITVLLAGIGLAMAHDPPAAADAAVGKGLLALAGAAAIATFCLFVDRMEREDRARKRTAAKLPQTYRDQEGA